MTRSIPVLALLCAALALAACDKVRPVAAEGSGLSACAACHGDAARDAEPLVRAAPPASAVGGAGGGAHVAHLTGSTFRAPLACAECHYVPTLVDHADGAVNVTMRSLAAADGASPAWNPASGTCSGVYCHGATLAGGSAETPAWSSTAGLACTSCHGLPPPAPHPEGTGCGDCHPGYAPPLVNRATHLDGVVQGGGHDPGYADPGQHGVEANAVAFARCRTCHGTALDGGSSGVSCDACHAAAGFAAWRTTCTFCHGDPAGGRSSPPVDTRGRSLTTNVSVGAHDAHVAGTSAAPLSCSTCHPDRTGSDAVADPAHVDGDGQAEVVLGARAGPSATWTRASDTSGTCASTYCHGAGAVEWTDSTPLGCTSCHGAPPPAPHSASTDCGVCHDGYTATTANPATHVDGLVQGGHDPDYGDPALHGYDVNDHGLESCKACHGTDLAGGTSGRSCNLCHGGVSWQTRCTFCHGDALSGIASPPVDTHGGTATTDVSVGAHAAHVSTAITAPLACADCHPDRTGSNVSTDAAHVDGDGRAEVALGARAGAAATWTRASDTSGTCSSTSCHGTAAVEWTDSTPLGCGSCHGAPPAAPHTARTDCGACHDGYSSSTVDPATHLNGSVEGPHGADYGLATVHGYEVNRTGLEACRDCHGTALDGGLSGRSCDECHGVDPSAWRTSCTFCHGDTSTLVASPPVDTQGRNLATNVSVGAHASHVATAIATPFACTQCHPDRAGSDVTTDAAHVDGDGVAEVVLGALATRGGAGATYVRASDTSATCAATYCHGQFAGGTAATVSWTSTTQVTCTSCHATPPPAPHTTSASCELCHTGYSISSVVAATHVDGTAQWTPAHPSGYDVPAAHGHDASAEGIQGCATCHGADLASCNACHATAGAASWATDCTFCHGDTLTGRASPPVDTQGLSLTTNVSVGAHDAHVRATIAAPLACTECHPDRAASNAGTDAAHVDGDGIAEVVLGPRAGAAATYARLSGTSATCSSTSCHGTSTVGWTDATPLGCASCHGAPPAAPHSTGTACELCHPGYTSSTVDASTHLDGVKQWTPAHPAGFGALDQHGYEVNREGLAGCKTCHGTNLDGGGSGKSCDTCHGGSAAWRTNCTFCHGTSPSGPASPPVDSQGGSAPTNVSVGVHASHVTTSIATPLACTQCHPDRAGSDVATDAAHVDGDAVAEVTFGPLARTGGAAATYARTSATSATCSSTYCHGQFAGGTAATVSWTDSAQATCTSCHASPPPAPHTSATGCGLCHTGYTGSTVTAATHVNGTVEWTPAHAAGYDVPAAHGHDANAEGIQGCATCHGADLASCNACHATAGAASWATDCTFCHGDTLTGRASPPVDTQGLSLTTNVSVGAHDAHVRATIAAPLACTECHPDRAGSNAGTDVAHLDGDGVAEVSFDLAARAGSTSIYSRLGATSATCSSTYCHGTSTVEWTDATPLGCASCHGAPPAAPHSTGTACELCHPGYTSSTVDASMHLDGTVQWTPAHPAGFAAFDQHGYKVNREGLAGCKTCHGTNLDGGGSGKSCDTCHGGTAAWRTSCTFCHGNPSTLVASPPVDTQGLSLVSNVSVGVHASHVGTTMSAPVACTECHPDRTGSDVATDGAHIDTTPGADIAFGTLAKTWGANATYTRASATSATCASAYCHGQFPGGSGADPGWTSTAAADCGSCHPNPPTSGVHTKHLAVTGAGGIYCYHCHNAVVSRAVPPAVPTIVAPALHVNGAKNVAIGGSRFTSTVVSGTWTPQPKDASGVPIPLLDGRRIAGTCSDMTGCHGRADWLYP